MQRRLQNSAFRKLSPIPYTLSAYTLIEILVGLTIIGLLFAFGYVSFREYSRRQAFASVVRGLKADLRLAQEKALSGEKPDDVRCNAPNVLTGYNFRVTSTFTYSLEAVCTGGAPIVVKSVDVLSAGVGIAAPSHNPILFKVLGQGTDISQGAPDNGRVDIGLMQAFTQSIMSVTIKSGGEIE